MSQNQNLTPQEIQVLTELGLDFNSEDLENKIQEMLNVEQNGDTKSPLQDELFASTQENFTPTKPLQFSLEARAVFKAGQELWKYYFSQNGTNSNPSLYDIKAYFQGVNEKKRMNNSSKDEKYNLLIGNLREALEVLATKIKPKVYEFGFLRG